jgi:hypothetical protein
MLSACKRHPIILGISVLLILMVGWLIWPAPIQEKALDPRRPSATYLLEPEDYDKFRPGRPKVDVLEDVRWRGNLEMATEYKGKSASAISYGICGSPLTGGGEIVWAIFVGEKFEKFVRWPEWGEGPIKVGDFGRLIRAIESDPVSIRNLEEAIKAEPRAPSQTGDPGLGIVLLRYRGKLEAARKKALARNTELRDQFNASRLKMGMTESEVESVLRAKPIKEGKVEAGPYKVYGSNELLGVLPYEHYSNILILFRDGKVSGIYSGYTMSSPDQWPQRESFIDLPLSRTRRK